MNPDQKCAVVTGCSKGLGLYMTKKLLEEGFEVVGCARSRPELTHPKFHFYSCDLTKAEEVKGFAQYIKRQKFRVYALINNAAVGALNQFLTTPTEKAQDVIQANYLSSFELSREMGKLMSITKNGRIIHIGSQTLLLKTPFEAVYAASKAAVETMMKISAKELAALGITVNMVSPGLMETDIIKGIPKERIDYMLNEQAIAKPIGFEDVWHSISFLMSEQAIRITGQNLYIGVV